MDSRFSDTADNEPTAQTNAEPGDVRVAPAQQSWMAGSRTAGPLDRPAEDDVTGQPASADAGDRVATAEGQEMADVSPGPAERSTEPEARQPAARSQTGTDADLTGDAGDTYPVGETSGRGNYTGGAYPSDTAATESRPGTYPGDTAAAGAYSGDTAATETAAGTYPGDTTATGAYRAGEAAGAGIDPGAETAGMVSDIDGRPAEHGAMAAGPGAVSGAPQQSAPAAADGDTPLMADSARVHQRWQEIQATFVDDPRGSVLRAASLAEEVVDSLATTAHERAQGLRGMWDNGDQADTERLRTALRNYRMLIDRIAAV